ncbi:MAG: cytidine deaminase [Saprospirales bacterium]|nr:cytidine deaminase [Saprospirales bacterium]MBK8492260.1 cytidine deaminase [Saprospirales bacterium]
MKEEHLQMAYRVFERAAEMSESDANLLERARKALEDAYAPYSNFFVGAAVLLENGSVVVGSNQENASFPLSLCAERVALGAVESLFPHAKVLVMAISIRNQKKPIDRPAAPCGACRQVIVEKEWRQKAPFRLLLQGESGPIYVFESGRDLLPLTFDPDYL